jgi:hypothetical protein
MDSIVCAPAEAPAPVAQFEKAIIEAECAMQLGCCSLIGTPVKQPDSCQQSSRLYSPVPDGALIFDDAMAQACLEQVKASNCDTFARDGAARLSKMNPCERVYTTGKNAKLGDACSSLADCAASTSGRVDCLPADGSWRCTLLQAGKAGDGCNTVTGGVMTVCESADSLRCDSLTTQCVTTADGVSCGADLTCLSSQFCDQNAGTCQTLHPSGTACSSSPQCTSGRCTDGLCETIAWYGTCF